MIEYLKDRSLILLKKILDYYFDTEDVYSNNDEEKIFLSCPKCYKIYTQKYFLTDICLFCLDDNIRSRL